MQTGEKQMGGVIGLDVSDVNQVDGHSSRLSSEGGK